MEHRAFGVRGGGRVAAVLLAAGLLAAACGNSSSKASKPDSGSSSGSSTSSGGLFPDSAMNQPQTEGTPQKGGSIKFGLESNLSTLVPGDIAQPADVTVGLAVYDPLVGYDDKGRAAPNELFAKWTNSPDLKTWTFTLRSGIKFSDGEDVNSQAVVTQMQALKGRPTCLCKDDMAHMVSIEAVDPLTVRFTLDQPNVAFPTVLANSNGYLASPRAWASGTQGINKNPIGSGAFTLSDYSTLTFVKNPNYWKKDKSGNSLPYLDKIVFVPFPDSQTRLQAVQSGDLDIMQSADTSNLVAAKKDSKLVVQPVTGASSTILVLNSHKPPFNDIRMRQAFNYALDRNAINQTAYQGARVPAYGALPATDPYYDDNAQLPGHDLQKAKDLVAALKKDGKSVSFESLCIATPEANTIFQVVEQEMKAAGIDVHLTQMDQGAYVARMFAKTGDFQEACFRSAQLADPNGLYNGLHTGGGTNIALWSNAKADAALDAGRATTDVNARRKQYDIVQQELAKDVVIVPLLFDLYGNIHTKAVSGLSRPRPDSLGLIEVGYLYRVAP